MERFAIVMPTRSARSVSLIFRFASSMSRFTTIGMATSNRQFLLFPELVPEAKNLGDDDHDDPAEKESGA